MDRGGLGDRDRSVRRDSHDDRGKDRDRGERSVKAERRSRSRSPNNQHRRREEPRRDSRDSRDHRSHHSDSRRLEEPRARRPPSPVSRSPIGGRSQEGVRRDSGRDYGGRDMDHGGRGGERREDRREGRVDDRRHSIGAYGGGDTRPVSAHMADRRQSEGYGRERPVEGQSRGDRHSSGGFAREVPSGGYGREPPPRGHGGSSEGGSSPAKTYRDVSFVLIMSTDLTL